MFEQKKRKYFEECDINRLKINKMYSQDIKYMISKSVDVRKLNIKYDSLEFQTCFLRNTSIEYYIKHPNYKNYVESIKIKKYPVELNDIPKIEEDNNISVRVYGLMENSNENSTRSYSLAKLYNGINISPKSSMFSNVETKSELKKINMLFYKNHYMYIKNMNKLMKAFPNGKFNVNI
jgi:hypothetical protein